MDAVYAWDQQDIYFYVPGGDDHFDYQGIFYQTSLRDARGRRSSGGEHYRGERQECVSGLTVHEAQDAGGGVSGGVTTLAEQLFERAIVFLQLSAAVVIVKQIV
jgi:hypothetical protein